MIGISRGWKVGLVIGFRISMRKAQMSEIRIFLELGDSFKRAGC